MDQPTSNNKVAIVTGGGSGIGLAITEKLSASGITTIIVGRDEAKLAAAQEKLGACCTPMRCDLTELDSIPALVEDIVRRYGRIDVLVNNAGINMKKEFTEVTNEEFQRILLTNVTAVFALSREVAKHMIAQGGGSIINISSMASQYGIPKVIAYTASKSAIEGMTRAMAVDLSPKGIRVNCIAPGFIATDMSAKALNNDPERKQRVLSRTPMGALGAPSDIGEAALFLPVDGGNSIGF